MLWRNKKKWLLWEDRVIDGVPYSFEHLRTFDMRVVKAARGDLPEFRATVRVVFDCHVVTEKADFVENNLAYWLDTGKNGRKFEPKRYKHSLKLPELIGGLPAGGVKCYVGKTNNYMIWEVDEGGGNAHYQAYFDIYKPKEQPVGAGPLLILYVQSAYLKDEPRAKQRERCKAFGQICAELAGVAPCKPKGPRTPVRNKR